MVLNFGGVFKYGIFNASAEDGDVWTYAGERNLPGNQVWTIKNENFNGLGGWTQDTSGTGSSISQTNGIVTLTSGTDDDSRATMYYFQDFSSVNEAGGYTIELRARGNYSAVSKQEWHFGLYEADSVTNYAANTLNAGDEFNIGGYNIDETSDKLHVAGSDGVVGDGFNIYSDDAGTYGDNQWHTYTLKIFPDGRIQLLLDGVSVQNSDSVTGFEIGNSLKMKLIIGTWTRGNPGAAQTLEVDYIRLKQGVE